MTCIFITDGRDNYRPNPDQVSEQAKFSGLVEMVIAE